MSPEPAAGAGGDDAATEPCDLTAVGARRLIGAGRLSPVELLESCLARADATDPAVNALVTRDDAAARDAAQRAARAAADAAARDAALGPLHGLPVAVKDIQAAAGLPTTFGAVPFADNVAAVDDPIVRRIRDAGAVVVGKTNLPRWSADSQSFNEIFGTTNNPWDLTRVPAGSSGGAAAAVAMGFTGFELGTDIGGSIRFPASFNGVWGHKPSWGVVPTTGYLDHVAGGDTEADINVSGPLARSCDDLELLLDVLARREAPWIPQLPAPRFDVDSGDGLRVAAWLDDPSCRVDAEVLAVLKPAVAALEAAGVSVDRDARPDLDPDEAWEVGLWLVRAAMTLAGEGDGPDHRSWLVRHARREELRRRWAEFFADFDVVVMPVAFVPPFEHLQEGTFSDRLLTCNGEQRPYPDVTRWTILTGMAYLPATVPPLGLTPADGLPIG
ncbi:MAG TPA: hypothetical protein DEP69_06935, partial [Acidimicrobiaceae bacterium]|nr:hypothetical protein [Acidimicrobiaceae bacterium]